ncbi:MAG: spermidine synthase [Anaerolineae bacterium]
MKRALLLQALVFGAGGAAMAVEMCASRLLAPYFGDSQLVWAVLISLILIYLTAGAALGGRWADRSPQLVLLAQIVLWAGAWVALLPLAARPVLAAAAGSWEDPNLALLVGAFAAVLLLLGPPVLLLGMVSPFAVRIAIGDVGDAGRTAGRISALSAAGSIVGTLAPAFLLIPWLGTRRTLLSIGLLLVVLGGAALWAWARRGHLLVGSLGLLLAGGWALGGGAIQASTDLIYEGESSYNYIRVVQKGAARHLLLNEGWGIHSTYQPGEVLTGHLFDYFLLAPHLADAPLISPLEGSNESGRSPRLCIIGLAGGTIAHQYTTVYGPVPIDGVELDGQIVQVARRYFDLHEPNVHVVVQDGRAFLARSAGSYDVIVVDAYHTPYIPFHLTTCEFFALARERLRDNGVLAINVGSAGSDRALAEGIADTLHTVFPSVYLLDGPEDYNVAIFATAQPTDLETIRMRLAGLQEAHLAAVAARALPALSTWTRARAVFTDDRAPVEQVVHGMVARYALGAIRDQMEE